MTEVTCSWIYKGTGSRDGLQAFLDMYVRIDLGQQGLEHFFQAPSLASQLAGRFLKLHENAGGKTD